MRRPSLRQIEAFKAFVETGGVSKAAEVLFVSQPAVSKLLNHLELDVGMKLIDRSSTRLAPTENGMRLYEEIDRVFSGVDQIGQAVAALRAEDHSQITIGVMPSFPESLLAEMARRARERRPDITLSFIVRSSEFIGHGLLSRKMDLGIVARRIEHALIKSKLFSDDALVVLMPPGHPLATSEQLCLTDLAPYPLIAFTPNSVTRTLTDAAFEREGVRPQVVMEATTAPKCCALVAVGLGCCILSPLLANEYGQGMVVRPLLPELHMQIFIARPTAVKDDKGVRLVQDLLEEIRNEV
jgi:DNA-binding transcriptional LysR family regulator